MNATSRFAIAAAAGLVLGGVATTPATAADLGGNCCADLEERVAQLEATTVRKGNTKITLTLSGHVNRGVLWYDDGSMTGFRVADNINSSSRFRLQGSAKIAQGWSAGYYMEFEFVSTGSFGTDQIDDRRVVAGTALDLAQPNGNGNTPFSMGIRQSHWWLKNDRLGTLSVGRINSATKDIAGTDLGGIALIANSDLRINGGSLFLRRAGTTGREGLCAAGLGCTGTLRMFQLVPLGDDFRWDGVRYDSPTLQGFTLSASVADDVKWDVALRYEKEWNGVRVASAIGYLVNMDEEQYNGEPFTFNGAGGIDTTFRLKTGRVENHNFRSATSILHSPTGLFFDIHYYRRSFEGTVAAEVTTGVARPRTNRPDIEQLWLAGGIRRNWFGIGNTSLYGEWAYSDDPITGLGFNFTGVTSAGGVNLAEITSSRTNMWGLGVVQNIDAAAMELYVSYRNSSYEVEGVTAGAPTVRRVQELEDTNVVYAGGRVKF
jgi:hypothetical protein